MVIIFLKTPGTIYLLASPAPEVIALVTNEWGVGKYPFLGSIPRHVFYAVSQEYPVTDRGNALDNTPLISFPV